MATLFKSFKNQKGIAPLLLLVVVGLIVFLVLSFTAPVQNGLLGQIFEKTESSAATPLANCWPDAVPAGAIAGQPKPIWCYTDYSIATDTHIEGPNSWVDEFNHGASFATPSSAYTVFESINQISKTQTWFHANHWMTDIAPKFSATDDGARYGGNVVRPNKAFRFEDFGDGRGKKLVIESDIAAGINGYNAPTSNAWVELVISNSPVTTFNSNNKANVGNFYAYNFFQRNWAFGCIMYPDGFPGCALVSNNGAPPEQDERWQGSHFQHPGSYSFGGQPGAPSGVEGRPVGDFWRHCGTVDPDTNCRDRFRMEIWKTGYAIYVNGVKYSENSGITDPNKMFPDELVNGDVYVYMGNIVGIHPSDTVRFHWDRFAVNPKDGQGRLMPPSAAPDFCLNAPNKICPVGSSPSPIPTTVPVQTPQPTAVATVAPTPVPTAVSTPSPLPVPSRTPIASVPPLPTVAPTPVPQPGQTAYNGVKQIPGTIQAEDFDEGGNGISFQDTDTSNWGNQYRQTTVDIENASSGGYNVGWTQTGEWLEYTVNVTQAGTYNLELNVASMGQGGTLNVEFNGVDKTGTLTVPNTNGWQSWSLISKQVSLNVGQQIMRINLAQTGPSGDIGNIDYLKLTRLSGSVPTPTLPPANLDGDGLLVTYYNNRDFTGTTFSRLEPTINFNWGSSTPVAAIGVDTFSARWTGYLKPNQTGTYTIFANTDDGVRVWINNQQIINNWRNQGATERSGTIQLEANKFYPLRVEYYENTGAAVAQLRWSGPSVTKQIIPQKNLYTDIIR